ncbi:MAG TPA: DNA-formamidopyrimidine glycosylase [Kiritimatiellia bacterium]|jgi:formamidopyrimidine-DNA glycosylase|nr:DNA-formamidopyrimidine glycosylase [Lentisphaerota bacterium]HOU21876.1 DNA-formamidopyrimidine glycosylase [Kiritimatiellia bacterium]
MPELPEVETVVCELRAAGLRGRQILQARILWPKTLAEPSSARFARDIRGQTIRQLSRRGKFIVCELSNRFTMLIHLRMTGHLELCAPGTRIRRHDRVIFTLDDNRQLHFADARKFGRIWLVRDPELVMGGLGPDPLTIMPRAFAAGLVARKRQLKPLLLDQTFLAGIGNIYADEALWAARLHPQRRADSLTAVKAAGLLSTIRAALRKGIRNLGTTFGNGNTHFVLPRGERGRNQEQLHAYGQTGAPCPRCGTKIRRILVGQRSTHICPRCQRAPR